MAKKNPTPKAVALAAAADWEDRSRKEENLPERFLMRQTTEVLRLLVARVGELEKTAEELCWAAECQLATIEDLEMHKRTPISTLQRHRNIGERLVRSFKATCVPVPNSGYPRMRMAIADIESREALMEGVYDLVPKALTEPENEIQIGLEGD